VIVVACIPAEFDAMASTMLTGMRVIATGVDRVYRVCNSETPINVEHIDQVNASLLVSLRSFPTMDDAKAWIERDCRQRSLLRDASTGAAS